MHVGLYDGVGESRIFVQKSSLRHVCPALGPLDFVLRAFVTQAA